MFDSLSSSKIATNKPAASNQTGRQIGQLNNSYEQKAYHGAGMALNASSRQPAIQKKCSDCELEEQVSKKPMLQKMEEEEVQPKLQMMPQGELQTKKTSLTPQTPHFNIQADIQKSRGAGSPLPSSTRSFMESRIGANFSKVRIHTDTTAHKLNTKLNAQAFATGNDIFFNKGKYNPETQSGKHLLAHELTHTLQQSGRMNMVQRQEEKVSDNKRYCLGYFFCNTIEQMKASPRLAQMYWRKYYTSIKSISWFASKGQLAPREENGKVVYDKLDSSNLTTVLDHINKNYASAIAVLDGALHRDSEKKAQLNKAYSKAVLDTMKLAERDFNPPPVKPGELTPHSHNRKKIRTHLDIYQQYKDQIHSFAWPGGRVHTRANSLLGGLTKSERLKLKIGEIPIVFDQRSLKSQFRKGARHSLPSSFTFQISQHIPKKLHEGLKIIAETLIKSKIMLPNTTQSMVMDLSLFGGTKAMYQFTRVWNGKKKKKATYRILIDYQGTVGLEALKGTDKKFALKKLKKHGIKARPYIFSNNQEYELFLKVIHALPDSLLSKVKGLKFLRKSVHPKKETTGGEYDENKHEITLYNIAFQNTSIRHGSPVSPQHPAMLTIIHEIGHAIDVHQLRPLDQEVIRLNKERNQLVNQLKGATSIQRRELIRKVDTLARKIKKVRKELMRMKSPSGQYHAAYGKFSTQTKTDKYNRTNFRKTTAGESRVRITGYAEKSWEETFAESFSFYVSSPATLRLLRPKLYAFMNKKYGLYPK